MIMMDCTGGYRIQINFGWPDQRFRRKCSVGEDLNCQYFVLQGCYRRLVFEWKRCTFPCRIQVILNNRCDKRFVLFPVGCKFLIRCPIKFYKRVRRSSKFSGFKISTLDPWYSNTKYTIRIVDTWPRKIDFRWCTLGTTATMVFFSVFSCSLRNLEIIHWMRNMHWWWYEWSINLCSTGIRRMFLLLLLLLSHVIVVVDNTVISGAAKSNSPARAIAIDEEECRLPIRVCRSMQLHWDELKMNQALAFGLRMVPFIFVEHLQLFHGCLSFCA